jgi:molybdate transport system substrate-binding protein
VSFGGFRGLPALVLAAASFVQPGNAQTITVAAAADLQFAMQEISARFQKETGKSVKVVYGSSGNFFQQIRNGAPFDIFFSADLDYAKKLQDAGLTVPGSLLEYATGRIVLWVPKGSTLDLQAGLRGLAAPSVRKIAIANPEHAPYGQAAVAAMRSESVYEQLRPKLVLGENISQAASFALSGSTDAGILALSLVLSPYMKDKGHFVEIPASDYSPIRQACVILRASADLSAAREFLNYMKTPVVAGILRAYGFGVPGAAAE